MIVVIVVTGGFFPPLRSVEVLNLDGTQLCHLPDLPDRRHYHTLSGGIICGGWIATTSNICLKFDHGKWVEFPWKLKEKRREHVSWTRSNGKIRLLGGVYSLRSSDIVSETGNEAGFSLKHDIRYCQALSLSSLFLFLCL